LLRRQVMDHQQGCDKPNWVTSTALLYSRKIRSINPHL
jgi:hypothetical protein